MAAVPKDVVAVQQNWALVADDLMGLGVDVFAHFFVSNPKYAARFEGINLYGGFDVSNPKMREHGLRIMATLGSWIHTLSDYPVVVELLKRQGQEHKERKIGEDEFKAIAPFLFTAVAIRAGSKFDRTAWTNIWAFIIKNLAEGWK